MPRRPRRKQVPGRGPQRQVPAGGMPGEQHRGLIHPACRRRGGHAGQHVDGCGDIVEGACPAAAATGLADPMSVPHWNGWGVDSSQRRFQSAETAQLAAEDVPRLKLKWAFGFPGAKFAFAQPTVMGGRVFVGSEGGKVYSLDANTGCTYWEFDAVAPVRSAITIGPDKGGWLAYFSDRRGNVHAVDVVRGEALWTTHVEDHPAALLTGSPMLAGTTLFVPISSYEEVKATDPNYPCCNFRGSVGL